MSRTALCACAPAFLGAFDFGLLALAGPRIAADVGATGSAYPWLFSASSFAYGAVVIPAAALTTRWGPARALATGLAVIAVGTAVLAIAATLPLTLFARALFGTGGAVAATAALALLAAATDERVRRSAFAALGGAVGGGFAAGALVSGVPSWRGVLVVVAALSVLAAWVTPRPAAPAGVRRRAVRTRVPAGAGPLAGAIVVAAVALARREPVITLPGLAVAGLLARAGLRRASPWLPRPHTALARVCVAGAATTASGVSATILTGSVLATEGTTSALLAAFGLAVVPGAWVARTVAHRAGHPAVAAAGLVTQAVALIALAAALAGTPPWPVLAGVIVAFGLGHVVANAGAAGAVATLAGPGVPAVGALLVAAQYLGGGVAPVLIAGSTESGGAPRGVLVAALVAFLGAVAIAGWPRSSVVAAGRRTKPRLSTRHGKWSNDPTTDPGGEAALARTRGGER